MKDKWQAFLFSNSEAQKEKDKGWFALCGQKGQKNRTSLLDFGVPFEKLEKLEGPLKESIEGFEDKVPTIVAVGATSVGKSTLLHRITQIPFFLMEKGFCTCIPTRMEIRKSQNDHGPIASISVYNWDDEIDNYVPDPAQNCDIQLSDPHDTIRDKVKDLLQQCNLQEGSGIITTKELRVHVVAKDFPVLNLLDLPGIIQSVGSADPNHENAERTKLLFKRYSRTAGNHTLFLCVVPFTSQPNDWIAVRLIQTMNLQDQSLGITTKCDRFDRCKTQDEFKQLETWLGNPEDVRLGYGYVAVGGAAGGDVDEVERDMFKTHCSHLEKRTSIDKARHLILESYLKQIYERWLPSAADKVLAAWNQQVKDFDDGFDPASTEAKLLEDLKRKVALELEERWAPLEAKLVDEAKKFKQFVELEQDLQLDEYRTACKDKLRSLMVPLHGDAKKALQSEESRELKLDVFAEFQQKLLQRFEEDLESQIIDKPEAAVFWATSPSALAHAKMRQFLKEVIQQSLGELNKEGAKWLRQERMGTCNKALQELDGLHQGHYGYGLGDALHVPERAPDGVHDRCKSFISKLAEVASTTSDVFQSKNARELKLKLLVEHWYWKGRHHWDRVCGSR